MVQNINPGNSEAIIHIASSVCVCLNILLSSEQVVGLLESNKLHVFHSKRIVINVESLIYDITEILTKENFSTIKDDLAAKLNKEERTLFNEYCEKVKKLIPHGYLSMVRDLMETLIHSLNNPHNTFLSQFYTLIQEIPDPYALAACDSFVADHLIRVSGKQQHHITTPPQKTKAHHPLKNEYEGGYAHLWGAHVYHQETPVELERINRRIKVNQTLRAGISNHRGMFFRFKSNARLTVEQTDSILVEAEQRPGDEDIKLFGALNHLVTANPELHNKFDKFRL